MEKGYNESIQQSRTRRTAPQADGSRYNDAATRDAASVQVLTENCKKANAV